MVIEGCFFPSPKLCDYSDGNSEEVCNQDQQDEDERCNDGFANGSGKEPIHARLETSHGLKFAVKRSSFARRAFSLEAVEQVVLDFVVFDDEDFLDVAKRHEFADVKGDPVSRARIEPGSEVNGQYSATDPKLHFVVGLSVLGTESGQRVVYVFLNALLHLN